MMAALRSVYGKRGKITCAASAPASLTRTPSPRPHERVRMALPSKGRMAEDTLDLLKSCQMSVKKLNPRQYVAEIPAFQDNLEVWFQRASDVMRKLRYGDVDIGIVGYDMFCEYGEGDEDLMVVHDALGFGQCHLALGIPNTERFAQVNDLDALLSMPDWTAGTPLRVVTGYHHIAKDFFRNTGFEHVSLLSADGALEAAPQMGSADIILDLVSSGVTMRENNLREIVGGKILESEGVLVASRKSLLERQGCLEIVHEMIERLEAHLVAEGMFSVQANIVGSSESEVAQRLLDCEGLGGLQGPTVAPVFKRGENGLAAEMGYYAVTVAIPRKELYESVQRLRSVGGSGVLVAPLTYIFDAEPERWKRLRQELGI